MPAQSPTERYAARLDEHLPTLASDAARRDFLAREEVRWLGLYRAFDNAVTGGEAPPFGARATDYTDTISEITRRLAPLREVAHA